MGHVREKRAENILETSLRDWLEDGIVPTPGQLKERYDAESAAHGDLTRSGLRRVLAPARYGQSSASEFNRIIDALSGDMVVLLRSLADITDLSTTTLVEWSTRAKALDARMEALKARVDSLLLLKSDTAGYISFVENGFLSLEDIASGTTAKVDTSTGEVTLNVNRSLGEGSTEGTQVDISGAGADFAIIEAGNVRFSSRSAGSSPRHLLRDHHSRWGMESMAKKPRAFRTAVAGSKPVLGELKIRLEEEEGISRILVETSAAAAGNTTVVAAQYSVDGYTWESVPGGNSVRSGTGNLVWRFPKTAMHYLKFVISKSSPDETRSTGSVYDFGAQQVKVWSEEYQIDTTGVVLYTETQTPTQGGNDVVFGRASLEVCEEVPEDTSIRYFLRAYDGSSLTDWVPVVPMGRDEMESIAVVDFTAPTEITSEDSTTVFDSSLNAEALNILRVDGSGSFDYRFAGPHDTIANFYVSRTDNLLSDIVLMRNIGYSDAKYPTVTADLKVADVECGWGLRDESRYYCAFRVKKPGGKKISLGDTQAHLDGRVVSGAVLIPQGYHTFETGRANWAPLTGTAPTTEDELRVLDPLYPYNHKYIIEGYTYPETFTGGRRYSGVDTYAQHKSTRLGRHDFLSKGFDPQYFALDVVDGPKTIVLLKFDSGRTNHENERVRLLAIGRGSSYTGVQLQARLDSRDSKRTPVLSYYRIRVK